MSLSPLDAAKMADGVYGIRTRDNVEQGFMARRVRGLGGDWDLKDGSVIAGSSGAVFRPESGFGLVLKGQSQRAGEMAVLVRGTVNRYDWLTNANFSVDPGPFGLGVHAGFNRVYQSMIDDVNAALGDHRGKIHVVGHSLGGAIANVVAARLYNDGRRDLSLYTFGAPRSGLPGFSKKLTTALGAENIYRVYDLRDPVPMVPIFPFEHAPTSMDGIRVGGSQASIWPSYHYMSSYTPLVELAQWPGLRAASLQYQNMRSVDYWLDQASSYVSMPGSSFALWALGKALNGILATTSQVLGLVGLGLATTIDTVAYLVVQAGRLAREVTEQILKLIGLVFKWLGRTVVDTAQLTAAFLSYVLGLLMRPLGALARMALDRSGD